MDVYNYIFETNFQKINQNCGKPGILLWKLARGVVVPVGRRSGGRLTTTLVATKNVFIFPFFSPSSPFLIEGVLGSKNLFSES